MKNDPGKTLDGVLLESAVQLHDKVTFFVRGERVEKDELFLPDAPQAGHVYDVGETTAGARLDVWRVSHAAFGVGVLGSASFVPASIEAAYGKTPLSGMAFIHAEIR